MSPKLPQVLLAVAVTLFMTAFAFGQEEMVANPFHKFWSSAKPGATAVHIQETKLGGEDSDLVPGGLDVKRITYKLVSADDRKVVVQQVVSEKDFLGYVQAAPTRYIYPAKVAKADLERILLVTGAQSGEETMTVGGKELKCKTLAGSVKGEGGVVTEFELWLADDVPGNIARQVRTTRQNGEVIAVTTTKLQSFQAAD